MYIGIDLGGTNIAAGIVDEKGKILHRDKVKTLADRHYSEIIKDMAELAKKIIADYGASEDEIEWVGIGSPGGCNTGDGIIIGASNLGFKNVPIIEEFRKTFNKTAYLANDADCAAYGEAMGGGARGCLSSVTVTLGTGIGGGVIIDGKILNGVDFGSELGHMIINFDGIECRCGSRGCWEMYASATALNRQTAEAMEQNPDSLMWEIAGSLEGVSGRTAFDAAKRGDEAAERVVANYLGYVAVGLVNICEIFQPEKILIGGGISNEGEYIIERLRGLVRKKRSTVIEAASLGNDAGIIGAAFLGAQFKKTRG